MQSALSFKPELARDKLQDIINSLMSGTIKWRIELNAPKSEAVMYGKGAARTPLALTLTTTLTTSSGWKQGKYLGVAVDKNEAFKLYLRRRTEEHTPVFELLYVSAASTDFHRRFRTTWVRIFPDFCNFGKKTSQWRGVTSQKIEDLDLTAAKA